MRYRTVGLVCGMAVILATLVAVKGHASELTLADPTAAVSICEIGSRIDDNGARGK